VILNQLDAIELERAVAAAQRREEKITVSQLRPRTRSNDR
jgi:hypothetical protein